MAREGTSIPLQKAKALLERDTKAPRSRHVFQMRRPEMKPGSQHHSPKPRLPAPLPSQPFCKM